MSPSKTAMAKIMTLRRNFGSLGPLVDKTRQTYNYTRGRKTKPPCSGKASLLMKRQLEHTKQD
ncbi:hypothetical protein CGLO_18231 [Colletotrichum gloeosporioides Cg-14]|uniref:Uncharacterized protein n=1 Tax=Colletotrichum gloeosporioides (strain Cg-14) TaxID=1237896 RepID=T0JRY3_COLGC|nr:hypothetical protein CGLO_18231 [Colletotrichum gloeosporioides Cg-14]